MRRLVRIVGPLSLALAAVLMLGPVPHGTPTAEAQGGQLVVVRGSGLGQSLATSSSGATAAVFTIPAGAGGDLYLSTEARVGARRTDSYRAKLRVRSDGSTSLHLVRVRAGAETTLATRALSLRAGAGDSIAVRIGTSGSTKVALTAKAWRSGSTEPSDQLRVTDASTFRLSATSGRRVFAYLSKSAKARTVQVGWADHTGPTPAAGVGATPPTSRAAVPPAGALYVATSGSDAAGGTARSPLRTIAAALAKAPTGGTVVVRGGSYHESVTISRRVTLIGHPGETVWLDGSRVVSSWRRSGSTWVSSYDHRFDSSPSFTRGASDGTAADWRFVDPAHPMAAHPDQVFVDGTPLKEVDRRSRVTSGTFHVDDRNGELVIGRDPARVQIRVSDLQKAISIRAADSQVRGIGVRRYATSLWMMGAVTVERTGVAVEDVTVERNAGIGLGVYADRVRLSRVTARANGLMGINANASYGLVADRLLVSGNNTEHFNQSPAAGGFKITRSRDVTVTASRFSGNDGIGLWFDESVHDATVVGNDLVDNEGHGLSYEISSTALIANNLVLRNHGYGMKINNSDQVQLWNNTIVGNNRPINLVQDGRRGSQRETPGHDPRRSFPDSTMPWLLRSVTVRNNVIGDPRGSANCIICVEDYSHQHSAKAMKLSYGGNLYHRQGGTPTWAAVWSRGRGDPAVYGSFATFRSATGQDRGSAFIDGTSAVSSTGTPTASARGRVDPVAWPAEVSRQLGGGRARIGVVR